MVKYTSSPWGFRYYTCEEYCNFMNKIGIKELCMFFDDPQKYPLAFAESISVDDINKVQDTVKMNGQNVYEIQGLWDFSEKIGLQEHIVKIKNQIDISAEFEVKLFRLLGEWNQEGLNDEGYEEISGCLTEIGNYAEKFGISIAVENHGGMTSTGKQTARIMKKVKADNVGVNYDPANFFFHGDDPYKALIEIKDYVIFTHFKSCRMINGEVQYCRLNEGIIDYKPIFKELKSFYKGYYSLEYEEDSDVESGTCDDFTFLKAIVEE